MNDEKWQEIKGIVADKFGIEREEVESLSEDEGPGEIEIIEFTGPLGKMRLTRTNRPVVLGKKVLGSRRIGSDASVQYTYSETEKSHKFAVYRFDAGTEEWNEMPIDRGEMIF